MRILLVEDHDRLARFTLKGLATAGFSVDHVSTVNEAMSAISTTPYDQVTLDLGLPDGDGINIIKALRLEQNGVPILVITARDQLQDKIKGLNAGADDYLVKPFEMDELIARLRALLRRPTNVLSNKLVSGNLAFDTISRRATVAGTPIALTRKELGLLELLLRRMGRVVPKDSIEQNLYSFDEVASRNSIEVLVHRLRRKLTDAGVDQRIHTLRGIGYLLTDGTC